MNKEGQFFLLAAVIISVIVISLGVTTNRANVRNEPGSFYDFTYEVEREVGEVFNYEIYTDITGGKVDEFVSLMSDEIKDEDPDSEFIFVFGNVSELKLKNYGSRPIEVAAGNSEEIPRGQETYWIDLGGDWQPNPQGNECYEGYSCYVCNGDPSEPDKPHLSYNCFPIFNLPGSNEDASGTVCVVGICGPGEGTTGDYDEEASTIELIDSLGESESITVVIDGSELVIPVSNYSQVYFIAQKEVGNESFITVT